MSEISDAFDRTTHGKQYHSYGGSWWGIGWTRGLLWLRIFGYGLRFKNWKTGYMLFSDREFIAVGKPVLIVGYWMVKWLKPRTT